MVAQLVKSATSNVEGLDSDREFGRETPQVLMDTGFDGIYFR